MATKAEKDAAKEAAKQLTVALAALAMIVEATKSAEGFTYTAHDVYMPLVAAGYVEVKLDITNEAGEVATRATETGVKYIMEQNQNQEQTGEVVATGKPSFNLVKVELPGARKRGGKGGNVYPFDKMEAGDSFFVPATADKPTPAKSLASTVSSATARFAVEVKDVDGSVTGTPGATVTETVVVAVYKTDEAGKRVKENGKLVKIGSNTVTRPKMVNTREFTIRDVADGAAWGHTGVKGAGIWRTK